MQLMCQFPKYNLHIHLQEEAKQWPNNNFFFDALPNPLLDACSPENFDQSVVPGAKSTIDSKSAELFQNCLRKLYSKLYSLYEHLFREHEVFIPSTYRKYYNNKWHGKKLTSLLNKNATNCSVFLVPPFPFTCGITWEFDGQERLAEIEYFLVHTIYYVMKCSGLLYHIALCYH